MLNSCQKVVKKLSKRSKNLFDFQKGMEHGGSRGKNERNSKREGRKKKNKRKNTRASLDRVATSSHLVKIRGLP
jgi:hypothetical protein